MVLTIEKLANMISKRFKIDATKITPESTLEDLGFDSLSSVDLIVLIEKEAGIYMSDEVSTSISNIADILNYAAAYEPAQ